MLKILTLAIFAFLIIGIVGVTFEYKAQDKSLGSLHLKKRTIEPVLLSIKEIDNISSQTNYYFTVAQKISRR
jgi:hypothetical protein